MALVYLPDLSQFFLWDTAGPLTPLSSLSLRGEAAEVRLLDARAGGATRVVRGHRLPLIEAVSKLSTLDAREIAELAPSVAVWTMACKFAVDLVARKRVMPVPTGARRSASGLWAADISLPEDIVHMRRLTASFPFTAHAIAVDNAPNSPAWTADALLRTMLNATVDSLLRAPSEAAPAVSPPKQDSWNDRWRTAMLAEDPSFATDHLTEQQILERLQQSNERGAQSSVSREDALGCRLCFRLELPSSMHERFALRFVLQSVADPTVLLLASELWKPRSRKLGAWLERVNEGVSVSALRDLLLLGLVRAARVFSPLKAALAHARPEKIELTALGASELIVTAATALTTEGFVVMVPSELSGSGRRRMRLRMRVGSETAGVIDKESAISLTELLKVNWQATLGDAALTEKELSALTKQNSPLVRFRGEWMAIDLNELGAIQERLTRKTESLSLGESLRLALTGEVRDGELEATVQPVGAFDQLVQRLLSGEFAPNASTVPPTTLKTELRPYQMRGLAWLETMASLGLGGCLADDMGLGKTVQILALLLARKQLPTVDSRPVLLIAPTSVLGNWEREIARFAPSLTVRTHFGVDRSKYLNETIQSKQNPVVVLASYGVLRRDIAMLSKIDWAMVVLDEAQNIKNALSFTARAARKLRASQRFALTGTPVENRLAELWSILEFANPGLLGSAESFRREFAVPIERHNDSEAATRLRKIVSPFVLRRLKSDPTIIQDLPAKNEMTVLCTLTAEQTGLYRAVLERELGSIEGATGITRRGRVLALLMALKQICNHPAQYLGEKGPLSRRSGKLARVTAMLEEAIAVGDKALVFTQFREMGDRLVAHFEHALGCNVLYLHGGTSQSKRDEMVQLFQEPAPDDPRKAPIFVLSLKAGGTGLNLTAANHVFHYDRWWNPAVEDQATDRAYRIGQLRNVQVHKLVCAGTLEEKLAQMIDQKRELASKVVAEGEQWITELSNTELRELFSL